MKHIHVVEPYHSVAMRRMSEPLIAELSKLYTVTTSGEVDKEADLNFHLPWHSLVGLDDKGNGKHAICYTHVNAGGEEALIDACERADLITCMTFTGRDELITLGVDPKKIWVIYAAADQYVYRKRLIGIVSYPQPNGRKRNSILLDLAWQYDLSPFQFLFIGAGWEELVAQLKSLGVAANTQHADTDDVLRSFYHMMDILLVTGYREGGPLPLLEAMASGTRVLAPVIGYASDLLEEEYLYDTPEELMEKLNALVEPSTFHHKLARAWRWQDYCAEHALLFGRLLGESVDLYPERGASRYMQLLDIIEEVKPKSIVEIGTWNGNRAIQMIQEAYRFNSDISYQGFDLFESQTAEQNRRELSKAGWEKKLVQRRLMATGANIVLVEGDTRMTLNSNIQLIPDFVFIDGGHSERTVQNDGSVICELFSKFSPNMTVVFDDYYHTGKPDGMGCNKFIDNLRWEQYEVTHLPVRTITDDGREIGMVKVKRHAEIRVQVSQRTYTTSGAWDDGNSHHSLSLPDSDAQSPASNGD